MSITTSEEAEKYVQEINRHLAGLVNLSTDAGLYSHAAVWFGIKAAFNHSPEQFEVIINMIRMYLEATESVYEPGFYESK